MLVHDVPTEGHPWIGTKNGSINEQDKYIVSEHYELHVRSMDDIDFGNKVKKEDRHE